MVFVLNFLNSKVQTRPFILEFSGFYILFNLQLSRFFVVLFLTAWLFYYNHLCLSRTFLIIFCCSSATQSVYHVSLLLSTTFLFFSNSLFEPLFSQRNYNITLYPAIVKRICRFFLHIFFQLYTLLFFPVFILFFRKR